MSVLEIRLFPDPVLTRSASPVQSYDARLKNLIRDLIDTMNASPGVGLAAPQVGVSLRVSVIDVRRSKRDSSDFSHGLLALINPILLKGEGTQVPREGCLSLPELLANVHRYQRVTVRTQNTDGTDRLILAEGFEALALQHEIDHLDGKLFIDRVLNIKTDLFRRKSKS